MKSQPSHYETLGLSPDASADDIAQAFAREIRIFRQRPSDTVARLAQLSVAYETLRNPVKRRAYDASLEAAPEPPQSAESKAAPFLAAKPEAPPEPRVASFIAASLREPANPAEPRVAPAAAARPGPAPTRPPSPRERPQVVVEPPIDDDEGPIDARRASVAAGVLGLGILALVTALPEKSADHAPRPQQPVDRTLTVSLPPAQPSSNNIVQPAEPATTSLEPPLELPEPAAEVVAQAEEPAPAPATELPPAAVATTTEATAEAALASSPTEPPSETPAEPAPVTAASARLPLPNATIARTIQRIGYPCGNVASIDAVNGGAPGVFKVTCSSGHSYQARPVNGSYRFRRLGNR